MPASPPDKINYHHEAIADAMIACPQKTQGQIAKELGYTQSWLSTVVNSSMFRAYLSQRRAEYNEALADKTQRRLFEVGLKAVDEVEAALESDELDPNFALDAMDKALQRAGMAPSGKGKGGGSGGDTYNQYNYVQATSEELAQARQMMYQRAHGEVIDQQTNPETTDGEENETEDYTSGGSDVG